MKRAKCESLAEFDSRCIGRWHSLYDDEAMRVTVMAFRYVN